jgi:hypothetical protein
LEVVMNMPSTEEIARDCFERARAFYKDGPKSWNKKYREGVSEVKRWRRSQGAYYSQFEAESFRGRNLTPFEAGDELRQTQNQSGNCGEMCCVALSFLAEDFPRDQLFICYTERPADHAFVIVGTRIDDGETMHTLFLSGSAKESYVVDVWANTFCSAADYYFEFKQKMREWAGQSKDVIYGGELKRPDAEYADICTSAKILVNDPDMTRL